MWWVWFVDLSLAYLQCGCRFKWAGRMQRSTLRFSRKHGHPLTWLSNRSSRLQINRTILIIMLKLWSQNDPTVFLPSHFSFSRFPKPSWTTFMPIPVRDHCSDKRRFFIRLDNHVQTYSLQWIHTHKNSRCLSLPWVISAYGENGTMHRWTQEIEGICRLPATTVHNSQGNQVGNENRWDTVGDKQAYRFHSFWKRMNA